MKYLISEIEYCINDSDVAVDEFDSLLDMFDDDADKIESCRNSIVKDLPSEIIIDVPDNIIDDNDEVEEFLVDKISEMTGWLVNFFTYEAY